MDPEISQRLGFLMNSVDLKQAQEDYLVAVCEEAGSFDELPDEIKMFFADAERRSGVHPDWEETVGQRVQAIANQLEV